MTPHYGLMGELRRRRIPLAQIAARASTTGHLVTRRSVARWLTGESVRNGPAILRAIERLLGPITCPVCRQPWDFRQRSRRAINGG